ncbi:BRCA1-associated ATM activator 1-like [Hippocampus comes]|uniref:BRCA1-associated ATM activator 1-like n=1 Tax=Hippocampus comes TaxID=109280 RepID=UPI00094E1440|nr:PREDICTED: BRCA1-associated ATM activator 1-like [Hippocampus comes]
MDRESATLLATVCALLADSAKPLPDDTSLEKLLDRLTEFSEAGVSLPDSCPCLLDFISTIASNSTSDPSIRSFALKLSGLLAATEDGYRALQVGSQQTSGTYRCMLIINVKLVENILISVVQLKK